MPSSEGIATLAEELDSYVQEFDSLDSAVTERTEMYSSRLPISSELMAQSVAEIMAGRPMEPMIDQRRPHKQEKIVAVYEVPILAGMTTVVFKADDGTLWQLSDVGLGWTAYTDVGEDWKASERFTGLLPARIKPRPVTNRPWHF